MTPPPRALRLLLAGFGNVGRELARILAARRSYPALAGLDVAVVGIATGSHGALANPTGIDLAAAIAEIGKHGRFTPAHPDAAGLDTAASVATLDYDVLVELSPLSVAGRGEPAISHVRGALERGRHVVSANKGPFAWAYRELTGLARERGVLLLHEAAVMDGAPVFNLARHCLRGNVITRVEGVLNSTTNIVLGLLERGLTIADAAAAARRAGVAEADPSADLDGWDAAVKLAVLANALMGAELTPEQVGRDRVADIDLERLLRARERGRRVKLVSELVRDGGSVRADVRARELPSDHPFARLEGAGSAIRLSTDVMGTITLAEEGPDLATTAYGVIADLFEVRDRAAR